MKYFTLFELHVKEACDICGSKECQALKCPNCGSTEFANIRYEFFPEYRNYGCTNCGKIYNIKELDSTGRDPELCMTTAEFFGY